MFDEPLPQPQLTTHTLTRTGPSRGKQRFDVQRLNPERARTQEFRPQVQRRKDFKKPAMAQGFDHDQLLRAHRGVRLAICLNDGTNLFGKLIDGDRYTLIIQNGDHRQLVFKSAIALLDLPATAPKGE